VRVLDLSRVLAGPFATMVLADLGADVLKVERPGGGDETRRWGPPFHGDDAAYFLAVNRGRRSLTLDLRDPRGAAILRRLAGTADVVVENFLPRQLTDLGLDRLRDGRERAVWVSVRAASEEGPAGDAPGYDAIVQARSGLMGITGHPGTGPAKVGVAIADVVTGLYAAVAALAGLVARAGDDRGPHIEVPLLESAISALVNQAANHLVGGLDPAPMGNEHPNLAPYGPVTCADRPLVVGVGNDRQFHALCAAIDRADLADDARFATNAARVTHRDALRAALGATFVARPAAAWRELLEAAGVPCAPIQTVAEVVGDEHVRAVDLIGEVDGPDGPVAQVGSPLRVDGRRPALDLGPPRLGEHTDEVLAALGLDPSTVATLRRAGVV
jgi:crotonobetainyl-CoA:carnitine CoA-transferase CaiB-like acyl-CoA transferase